MYKDESLEPFNMNYGVWRPTPLPLCTVCPRSIDPFLYLSYYIKRVTTSWTDSLIDRYNISVVGPLFLDGESVKVDSPTLLHRRIIGTRQFKGLRTLSTVHRATTLRTSRKSC